MLTLIAVICVFGLLIIAHEFGHLIAAKRCGVIVYEFSMGFGPKLFAFHHNETLYTLRLLPLGGYVRMAGGEEGEKDLEGALHNKSIGQRVLVSVAGPLMNLVLAVFLFIIVYSVIGVAFPNEASVIGEAVTNAPAQVSGLLPGDHIQVINGQPVNNWLEMQEVVQSQSSQGNPLIIQVDRAGQALEFSVVPQYSQGRALIGITPEIAGYERVGLLNAIGMGFSQTANLTVAMVQGFAQMFTQGVNPGDLAGPVGIIDMIGEAAQSGLARLITFAGFLSINLAILNLLPIPALDGSKLVFLLVEKIRGRAISPEREGMIHLIGFALLMGLVLVLTYQDIMRIFMN